MKEHNAANEIEALKALLEIYGADRSRWPARDRLKFAEFLSESAEARRLLADAEAFDRLLNMAPEPQAADLGALSDRILAAAGPRSATVTAFPQSSGRARVPARPKTETDWPAAALLAASLILGIFAGVSGYADGVTSGTLEVAASGSESNSDVGALAFGSDTAGLLEEDLL